MILRIYGLFSLIYPVPWFSLSEDLCRMNNRYFTFFNSLLQTLLKDVSKKDLFLILKILKWNIFGIFESHFLFKKWKCHGGISIFPRKFNFFLIETFQNQFKFTCFSCPLNYFFSGNSLLNFLFFFFFLKLSFKEVRYWKILQLNKWTHYLLFRIYFKQLLTQFILTNQFHV